MASATQLKRKHDLRQMTNIILWLLRTSCQWRILLEEWPLGRKRVNKEAHPFVLSIGSQRVKLSPMIYDYQGIDANKRVNGPLIRRVDSGWLMFIPLIKLMDPELFH